MRYFSSLFYVMLLIGMPHYTFANNEEFSVESVLVIPQTEKNEFLVEIEAKIAMSDEQKEILTNGIPLTYNYNYKVYEKSIFSWFKDNIQDYKMSYQISYNTLAEQYIVVSSIKNRFENFPTLSLALNYIANPKEIRTILPANSDKHYIGSVKLKLDIEALPTPLRIPAYFSSEWNLNTGWKSWEF